MHLIIKVTSSLSVYNTGTDIQDLACCSNGYKQFIKTILFSLY